MDLSRSMSEDELAEAHVVVVDDDELVTSSLSAFLSLELDMEPRIFNDSKDALSHIQDSKPDLIISDFLMPEVDGIELLGEARKLHPEVPRVLLTGYADKQNAIKAINEVQLFRYIEKPWKNELLSQVVRRALERIYGLRGLLKQLETLYPDEEALDEARGSIRRLFS